MALQVGATIDRYVVEAILGQGGMAVVYAVRHTLLGTRHALKVLAVDAPGLRDRLVREGRLQGGVRHANVVAVTDLVDVNGAPGLVLELVEGPTLDQLLARGPLPIDDADRIARGLLDGLAAAHAQGLVHRDLKPANVLLAHAADGWVPKIADFGLVKALREGSSGHTRAGAVLGTPGFMAPEQLRDASGVDARADLFALGAILYQLVAGRPAFTGTDPIALYDAMRRRAWVSPERLVPDLPPRMVAAVRAALEPDLDRRVPEATRLLALWSGSATPTYSPAIYAPSTALPSSIGTPKYSRPLVGRETELTAAEKAVEERGVVVLLGTGGVGKTRMAAEIARRCALGGRAPTWIDLQEAYTVEDVLRAAAWGLDIRDPRPDAIEKALRAGGDRILVLDNAEQLTPEAVRAVAGWVDAAPDARWVVTSRRPLGLPDEHLLPIAPLPIPDDDDALLASDALRLFLAAAPEGVDPGAISPAALREMLGLLDGLPLAMELAAARLQVLGLDELQERLSDRFAVLSSPGDDRRQGTLHRTIEWSWTLLSEDERLALAEASVFRGGFTLVAAEAVLSKTGTSALDALHGLVRHSLVVRDRRRFRLFESIRAFAAGQRAGPSVHARHAAWFGAQCQAWLDAKESFAEQIDAVMPEIANLDVVVRRAATAPELVPDAMACARMLAGAYELRGPASLRLPFADAVVALPATQDARAELARGTLRVGRARWRRRTGDVAGARADLTAAQGIAEAWGDREVAARVVANIADLDVQLGDHQAAWERYRDALTRCDALGMDRLATQLVGSLATLAWDVGQAALLDGLVAEAMARLRRLDDPYTALHVHKLVGTALLERDRLAEADEHLKEAVRLAESTGDRRTAATVLAQRGLLAEARGDLVSAEGAYSRAAAGMREDQDAVFAAYYDGFLGRVWMATGRWAEGRAAVADARARLSNVGDPVFVGTFGYAVALADARTGDVEAVEAWSPQVAAAARFEPQVAVSLARGFRAECRGDRAAAAIEAAEARTLLEAEPNMDLATRRIAVLAIEELEARLQVWQFAADGRWWQGPAEPRVDQTRHGANARVLSALVARRQEAPGEALEADALALAGWPGERILAAAAANRVRVALSTLRKEGLADLIVRREAGWLLDPDVPIAVVPVTST